MKILIADDHAVLRTGMRALFEAAGMNVVGEANDGHEALERARELRPDVIVMDVGMPRLNGVDATKKLLAERTPVDGAGALKIIGLSGESDPRRGLEMLEAGAVGFLLKSAPAEELIHAIRVVAGGSTYVTPAMAAALEPAADGEAAGAPLSAREREVLQLVAEGKSSKEIAQSLSLAVPTVETHRRHIMDKLGLRTTAELTKYAIRQGLTSVV